MIHHVQIKQRKSWFCVFVFSIVLVSIENTWGYYTVARRYEFYVVERTISHEWTQHKIYIFELTFNVLMTGFFDDFPKISDHFLKISEDFPKLFRAPDERSRTFPNISEDSRRLSRKTRRCFDHTPTNLSTLKETNLISVKSSISSLVRIWKIRNSSPGCSFVWIL